MVLSGMIAKVPHQGGATWAILQYLLGLRALGCDVTFVEPIDGPVAADQIEYCGAVMARFGLDDRWALLGPDGTTVAGLDDDAVQRAAKAADLLINVSGMLRTPRLVEPIGARVYLDLDPAFVQMWHTFDRVDMGLDGHTHFVTIADTIGAAGSPIPTCGRAWMPTLPPVVLDEWPFAPEVRHDALTTIAHWRGYGSIHHDGVHYGQKAHSLRPLFDLPRRVDESFLLALAIHPGERPDVTALHENGWRLADPADLAATPDAYRRFVQTSRAELGIAKSGYVVSNSGWFSDRSACYLASGRPVIAQDTGFGRRLPTGDGLFVFSTVDDVAVAVDALRRDPEGHRAAARAIAEEHLASDRVLGRLLEAVAT